MTREIPDIRLADLLARTEDVGGCMEWTRHALAGKFPQWRVGGVLYGVRRLLWLVIRGSVKRGHQIGVKCENPLCVHPDHLVSRTKGRAQLGHQMPEDCRRRIAATKRGRSTLSIDQVREIRASTEPGLVLDQRYGLTRGYASHIRLNKVWKDHSDPFAGLRR